MKKYKRFLGTTNMKNFADRGRPGNKLRRYRRSIIEAKQHKSFKGICISNWWYRRRFEYNPLKYETRWYVVRNSRKLVKSKRYKELFG